MRGFSAVAAIISVAALAACGGGSLSLTNTAPPASPPASDAASTPAAAASPAADTGSPAPTAPATAPPPGTTLATVDNIGATTVISNTDGDGFTAVHDLFDLSSNTDQSTIDTYDVAGNQLASLSAGSFTGDCGAADVENSAGRLIITLLITTTPAQGINPETYGLTMTAWNATTGSQVWTTTLQPNQDQSISCPSSGDGIVADLWNFVATLNGQWGVFEEPLADANGNSVFVAINLATGKTYTNANLMGVLGNDVVTGSGSSDDGSDAPTTLTITTPGSWQTLGTAAGPGAQSGNPQLQGDLSDGDTEQDFAVTGYTGTYGTPGSGIGAVATPDGDYLVATYTDSNGNDWYGGYTLPSLHQVWSDPIPQDASDQIVGISETSLLITRSDSNSSNDDTYLLSLDPKTGQQQWQTDISSGGSVCDLTSTEVLVAANGQLATLSAATGKQLSYESDPYTDDDGDAGCPAVVETGLSGIGITGGGDVISGSTNYTVLQLLTP